MDRRPKKKTPSDYPQFAFRLNNEDEKAELTSNIDRTLKAMNEGLDTDVKPYSKSELIIKAINIGLTKLGGKKK